MRNRCVSQFYDVVAVVALCLTVAACDTSNPDDANDTLTVLVANQGNFSEGTGSLTAYNADTGLSSVFADNFGSIIQSIHLKGDTLYVMANSASRIDILNAESGDRVGQIMDVVSPRYMTIANGSVGYVTNLYSSLSSFTGGAVTIIDLDSETVLNSVMVGDNPEGIVAVGPRIFVANSGFGNDSTITALDQTSGAVIGFADIGCYGPRFLTLDADAELFVFCTGRTIYDANFNIIGENDGEVVVLDGASAAVIKRIPIAGRVQTAGGSGQDAFYSPESNQIFFVKDQTTIVEIDTITNSAVEVFSVLGDPIGAVAYDNLTKEFYLGRVPGFDEAGSVTVHNESGMQTASFQAGIAPSHIIFNRREE